MNSNLWKIRCSLNPKAQVVKKAQRQLRPEPYFLNRGLRFLYFSSTPCYLSTIYFSYHNICPNHHLSYSFYPDLLLVYSTLFNLFYPHPNIMSLLSLYLGFYLKFWISFERINLWAVNREFLFTSKQFLTNFHKFKGTANAISNGSLFKEVCARLKLTLLSINENNECYESYSISLQYQVKVIP